MRDVLRAWQVADDQIDTAELAVCELVSNAVRHIAPGAPEANVTLTLRHNETQLIAEVADPDNRPPVAETEASEDAEKRRRPRRLHHEPAAVTWARKKSGPTKRALAQSVGISEQLMGEIDPVGGVRRPPTW